MKFLARSLCSAALAGVCLGAPARADQPEDALITTKVKMALLTDATVDALGVDVDTSDGRVTLHGKVDTPAGKTAAESLARQVRGVSEVRNLLAVVPQKAREDVRVSDQALTGQIEALLGRDKALEDSDIAVKSVNNGIVVLSGSAKTLSAHRRALEDARAVAGVRRVASEIRSPDELADAEIWEEGRQGAAAGLAAAAADAWITTKVKVRLLAKSRLSPFAINVDTRQAVVTLFGTVGTEELKNRAGAAAHAVSGVKGVENDLQVVPDALARRVDAADERVAADVRERLAARDSLEGADIDVAVKNGIVRLTGTVETRRDHLTALTLARDTAGVASVIDSLEVRSAG